MNKREYPWGIVSNGLLLNRTRLDSLLAAGMHSITISLDGFEEAHNWLRGNRRSFEGAVNAIAMLAEEKEIVWDVVTCVNQKNLKDLMLLKDFLIELGVKNWRIFTIFPVGRAAETPELQIDDTQFTWILKFIRHCRAEGKIHASFACEGFLGNYEGEVRDQIFHCNAGISTASVLNVTGHKDEEVCRYLAEKVSAGKKTTVVCTGGIHMDGITKEQIAEIVEAMRIIAGEIVDK